MEYYLIHNGYTQKYVESIRNAQIILNYYELLGVPNCWDCCGMAAAPGHGQVALRAKGYSGWAGKGWTGRSRLSLINAR